MSISMRNREEAPKRAHTCWKWLWCFAGCRTVKRTNGQEQSAAFSPPVNHRAQGTGLPADSFSIPEVAFWAGLGEGRGEEGRGWWHAGWGVGGRGRWGTGQKWNVWKNPAPNLAIEYSFLAFHIHGLCQIKHLNVVSAQSRYSMQKETDAESTLFL